MSEPGDFARREHLRDCAVALHRVRRAFRHAAVRRGLSGRVHFRRSGSHRDARTIAGEIPRIDWRGEEVTKHTFERLRGRALIALLLLAAPAFAGAADSTPKTGKAAIASAHKLATEAGFEVIAQGGNAFDAAIAVAAALSVVEPHSSGIGGGGFFLLHRASDGKDTMVDARETAPAAVDAKKYLDAQGKLDADKARNGPLAAAIPGEPAGLVWLAQHYGKLPLAKSFAPAIRIAREGFQPDERFLEGIASRIDVIKRYPGSAALYLDNG